MYRPACSGRLLGRHHRVWRSCLIGFAASFLAVGCGVPRSTSVGDATESAAAGVDRLSRLRAAASEEVRRPSRVVRVLPTPPMIDATGADSGGSRRSLEAIAEAHLDPNLIRLEPVGTSPRSNSPRAIRGYVRGRMLLAAGRPGDAIEPLESAIRNGAGDRALRMLAIAFDGTGNVAEALAIRRRLALRGSADVRDLEALGRELARRRRSGESLAIFAGRYLLAADRDSRAVADAVVDLVAAINASEGDEAAAEVREAVLAAGDGDLLETLPPSRASEYLLLSGDAAAGRGRPVVADERWRSASRIGGIDPAVLRPRLLWSSASLGRDATMQEILLDSVVTPTGADREMFALLRDEGVELPELREALVDRILENPDDRAASTLLVAIDPKRAAEIIGRLDPATVPSELRVALVDAAIPSGPRSGVLVAAGVVDSIGLLDAVADRLVAGPWSDQVLLDALLDDRLVDASTETCVIRAELLRRYERPGLADDALRSRGGSKDDAVERVVRMRIAGDIADPEGVLAVGETPFDAGVESARVEALLAAGEPELALAAAERLIARTPDHGESWAAFGSAVARFRGRGLDAAAALARAIRLGDRRWSTRIGLADAVRRVEGGVETDSEIGLAVEMVATEPAFRPLIEADRAIAAGDLDTAARLLDGLLEDRQAREEVLVRIIGVWQATGRMAGGRRRLESLLDRHPADPGLQDAIFALRQADGDRAALLDSLRRRSAGSLSGHPRRRLELLLAETPGGEEERARLAGIRLGHRPVTVSRRIDALEDAIRFEDSDEVDLLVSAVARLDPAVLTPRQRRRLATVAAAIPDLGGREIVDRVGRWYRDTNSAVEADVASALIGVGTGASGSTALTGLRPAAPATVRDVDWRMMGLARFDVDPAGAADLLRFALRSPDAGTESGGGLPRTALAVAMASGGTRGTVAAMLDEGDEAGLDWAAIYEAGGSRREILAAVSGDASLLDRPELAISLLDAAATDPDVDALTLNNLGFALLEGDGAARSRASEVLDRAFRMDAANPSILDSLGWCRYLEDRNDGADPGGALALIGRSLRARAAEGRPVSSEVLLHYGDASWRAGRETDAVAAWSRISERILRNESLARRLAAFAGFQRDVWGRVLIDPRIMHDRIDGRWGLAAEARLSAIAEGRTPPVTPTWSESGGVVQDLAE